jgi:hypothetical protein
LFLVVCAKRPRLARISHLGYVLRRLGNRRKLRKILRERMTEPLHLNILSLFVALFGNYRSKVNFDLIVRQQYAFPILFAADLARTHKIPQVTIAEMGVAAGAGLMNMCQIAERVRALTGVRFHVVGFDTGTGMPPAVDYRDLPELYQAGDYPMDFDRLRKSLPAFAELVVGNLKDTVPARASQLREDAPLAFLSVDVDYYSSAKHALDLLTGPASSYLPIVPVYLDDIGSYSCSPWTGEMLAVNEFNEEQPMRKIAPFTLLRSRRIFKNPQWIDRMFACHVHDHPIRSPGTLRERQKYLANEYL